jgi:hypothetical protein
MVAATQPTHCLGQLAFFTTVRVLGHSKYHSRVALPRSGTAGANNVDTIVDSNDSRRDLVVITLPNALVSCLHSCVATLSDTHTIGADAFSVWNKQG